MLAHLEALSSMGDGSPSRSACGGDDLEETHAPGKYLSLLD